MPADASSPRERVGNQQELDRAFLDWFEARLAIRETDLREEDVLDYLIALALYDSAWVGSDGAHGADHAADASEQRSAEPVGPEASP